MQTFDPMNGGGSFFLKIKYHMHLQLVSIEIFYFCCENLVKDESQKRVCVCVKTGKIARESYAEMSFYM